MIAIVYLLSSLTVRLPVANVSYDWNISWNLKVYFGKIREIKEFCFPRNAGKPVLIDETFYYDIPITHGTKKSQRTRFKYYLIAMSFLEQSDQGFANVLKVWEFTRKKQTMMYQTSL